MKEHQDISHEYRFLEEKEIEAKKLKELLRKRPKMTKDNLVQIDRKTWILKRNGETKEQARQRFLKKYMNNDRLRLLHGTSRD